LGDDLLTANIASLLMDDHVELKENEVVGIEIPEW